VRQWSRGKSVLVFRMGHNCCSHDHDGHEANDQSEGGCCQEKGEAKAGGCCGGGGCGSGGGGGGGGCCQTKQAYVLLEPMEMAKLPSQHLIARFRRGIEMFDRRVFELSERQIDQAFLPDSNVGRWPVRVLMGHVADADVSFVHRMRRVVAEDRPVFSEWDENAFVDSNIYGNDHSGYADTDEGDHARVMHALGGPMAVIHTMRQWAGAWLLSLSEEQLDRTGMHPTRGEISVRTILAYATWHLEHHAQFLEKKLDLMVPAAQTHEHSQGGCCGGH